MDKLSFPAAFKRGAVNAHRDINKGDNAVALTMKRMLEEVYSSISRSAGLRQSLVEINEITRDGNLEISRIEKRLVQESQEVADEISGYVSVLNAYISSASAQGVKARRKS